jgi:hypothetical protein
MIRLTSWLMPIAVKRVGFDDGDVRRDIVDARAEHLALGLRNEVDLRNDGDVRSDNIGPILSGNCIPLVTSRTTMPSAPST